MNKDEWIQQNKAFLYYFCNLQKKKSPNCYLLQEAEYLLNKAGGFHPEDGETPESPVTWPNEERFL